MKIPSLNLLTLVAALPVAFARGNGQGGISDLEIEAGYHVIYSFSGTSPPPELYKLIRQGKVGAVHIAAANVDENINGVIANFQDAYKHSPGSRYGPLPIITDQEGGVVRNFPGGPEDTAKDVGLSKDPYNAAYSTGREAARVLREHNVHINLAPVLDVFREPGDFQDQWNRSYSNDPKIVAKCAAGNVKAQKRGGVFPAAKHFPGLGSAATNQSTDVEPVTLDVSLEDLRSIELVPYESAISAGLDIVMGSWATFPNFDPDFPAGLSKKWIQGELRGRLEFDGVIISDHIEAGGLDGWGGFKERAVLASAAGNDLFLTALQDIKNGEMVHRGLVEGLKNGSLSRKEFAASTKRILKLRREINRRR